MSLVLDRPEAVERMPVVTEKHVELHCRLPLRGLVIPLAYNLLLVLLCAGHGFLTRYEGPFTRTVNVTIFRTILKMGSMRCYSAVYTYCQFLWSNLGKTQKSFAQVWQSNYFWEGGGNLLKPKRFKVDLLTLK